MSFTILENGADSLKKAKESIENYENVIEEYATHHMKDAVIYLHHSIEILLKYLLTLESEYLIFEDLKKLAYAKKELMEKQKEASQQTHNFIVHRKPKSYTSVFDVPKGKKLKTIGLEEAKLRVQYLSGIDIHKDFEQGIEKVQVYRNQITHHTININSEEKNDLISNLKILHETTLKFFEKNIKNFMEVYDGQRFEISQEEWDEHQREVADYYYENAMSKIISDDM